MQIPILVIGANRIAKAQPEDVLIARVACLKGFLDAINAVYPEKQFSTLYHL